MDWQSLRKQRLAKAASSHEQAPPQGRLEGLNARLTELWRRFAAASLVEKSIVGGGLLLVAISVPVAIVVLTSGGGGPAAGAAGATSTPADVYVIDDAPTLNRPATPTLEPLPTATARPTKAPTDEAPVNRADCDEISGTPYESDVERDWYAANCLDDGPSVSNPPGSGPPPAPTQPPPPPGPPPTSPPAPSPTPSGPSNATIIGYAVDWLNQDAPESPVVSGSCTVSLVTSSQWLVSCSTRPPGCTGSACLVTASVCVAAPTYTIWRC